MNFYLDNFLWMSSLELVNVPLGAKVTGMQHFCSLSSMQSSNSTLVQRKRKQQLACTNGIFYLGIPICCQCLMGLGDHVNCAFQKLLSQVIFNEGFLNVGLPSMSMMPRRDIMAVMCFSNSACSEHHVLLYVACRHFPHIHHTTNTSYT